MNLLPAATVLLVLFVLLVAAAIFINVRGHRREVATIGALTYVAQTSLLSPAERSFFGVLQRSLHPDYYICPKVRLADIIKPSRTASRSGWRTSFNRIAAKHVDFAICNPDDMSVLGVVELDDKTHERFERGFRDDLVDTALSGAGIQVIRVSARHTYPVADLRSELLKSLNRLPSATRTT